MAISYIGVTTAGDSNGSSLAITRASTTTDDVNVLDLYLETGVDEATLALSFSNGTWTKAVRTLQVGSAPDFQHLRYLSKYAGEGASCTLSWSASAGSIWRTAAVTAYRGVDTTTPQDTTATGQASGTSSTSATAPGLTTVTNGALVHYGEADFDGRTVTPPTGSTPTFTERTDFGNVEVADGLLASAGATGDKTGTLSASSWNTAGLLALRPAGAAAATSLPLPVRLRPYLPLLVR